MRARKSNRLVALAGILAVAALALAASQATWAGGHGHGGGKRVTCRGPGSLSGGFSLSNHRKVKAKRTECRVVRKVVKRFPKSCADAYAAQGHCKVRASARWRCSSRIVGPLEDGAPSKETCKHRRSKMKFEVTYEPPIGGPGFGPQPRRRSGPFDEGKGCIDTSRSGTVIPPPPLAVAPFEIHALRGVTTATGQSLQRSLLNHDVARILNAGLAEQPRIYPKRLPILLTPRAFNPTGWTGLTVAICGNPGADAIVVRADKAKDLPSVVAHEMFHAYSDAIATDETWWEEASATWSQHKDGYPEETAFDIDLQYPNKAIDSTAPGSYPYAMSRFVQFLDDKGLVGGPSGRWQLQRQVISQYPDATAELAGALDDRGTSIGKEVAAFWGDRLREKPRHGPQLRPGGPNANEIEVKPGTTEIPAIAEPLHTKFLDFTLAGGVKRVEFEFDPPSDGYFWGAPTADQSQRFLKDDSVSFCVGGGDQDDLEWPIRFPVTFTNGNLTGGELEGKITVHAQSDAEQCTSPSLNRACRVLGDANIRGLLGAGSFPFSSESRDRDRAFWVCFYHGSDAEVQFNLVRELKLTSKQVRRGVKRQIEELGLQRLDGVGDLAGYGTFNDGEKNYGIVALAVGKEHSLIIIGPGAQRQNAITLSKRIAGQLD